MDWNTSCTGLLDCCCECGEWTSEVGKLRVCDDCGEEYCYRCAQEHDCSGEDPYNDDALMNEGDHD